MTIDRSSLTSLVTWAFIVAMCIAVGDVIGFVKLHSIGAIDHDAKLIWNDEQALLFIGTGELGKKETIVQIGHEAFFNFFGGVLEPDDERHAVEVIRYTPRGLERYLLEGERLGQYWVVDGQIYKSTGDRWSQSHFEKATEAEVNRLRARMDLGDPWHPNPGWSLRSGVLLRPEIEIHFPMQIGGNVVEVVVRREGQNKSIQLRVSDHPPQDIWHRQEGRRWVSKEEYERHFPR